MHRRLRKSVFDRLRHYPMRMVAYGAFQRALRHSVERRSDRLGMIICVLPEGAAISHYERAAELVLRGTWQRTYEIEDLYKSVQVIDCLHKTGKEQLNESFRGGRDTIFLAESLDLVDPKLRFAADLVLQLEKPSARQIMAARQLSGARQISAEIAETLAHQSMDVIEASITRRNLDEKSVRELQVRLQKPEDTTPPLEELPGYTAPRAWVHDLKRDVAAWKSKKLSWGDVDHGAVIYGAPGTGKTLFAKALARSLDLKLVATSVGEWQAAGKGHLGDMLRAMRASFEAAKAAGGAVLFIDELDSIGDRENIGSGHDFYEMLVVNTFLELSAGIAEVEGVIVIGATNHLYRIDPAILRAGRLEKHIKLELPSPEERAEIVSYHLRRQIAADELREVTDPLVSDSAADLELLARKARRRARSRGNDVAVSDVVAELPRRISMPKPMAYRVAVHEIGHALVALDSGFAETVLVNLQTTYVEGAVVDGGRTTYQIEHDDIPGERFLTARIRICLAGMAAEEVLLGDRSTGSGGVNGCDLEEATNIAARMAASYGMGQSLRFVAPAMRVDRAFRSSPDLYGEIDRILSREYDAAKDIIVSYRILAEVFVEQIIAQKSIEFNREQLASAGPRLAN